MKVTDGYVIVRGDDGWYYYAELDARGNYTASPYKVNIDDPEEIGIPKRLQRAPVRQAEDEASHLMSYGAEVFEQPDGTYFLGKPIWMLDCSADPFYGVKQGYVISIGDSRQPLINYNGGDPFWTFVLDEESGWYYYAICAWYTPNSCIIRNGQYLVTSHKVGIDDPPGYNPPTAVQERSWGAVKHRFHK